ncbi:MAG: DUF1573 domain-containing protein [Gemmataceae bacterium]|nr:DUF1573 domain-containing protein [Gemmataceae bacterium]
MQGTISWAAVCLACLLSPSAWGQLACSQASIDRGEVFAGAPFRHVFTLVNQGKATIEILEARPGCGCLRPPSIPKSLPPGESFSLPVEIHTLTQPEGPQTFFLTLRYRDRNETQELRLEARANIRVQVGVAPAAAAIYTDRAMTHTLTLRDSRENPLRVLSASSSLSGLKTRLEKPGSDPEGGIKQIIHIDIPESLPAGRHLAWISLVTTDAGYSGLQVPLTVVKRDPGRVTASPEMILLLHRPEEVSSARLVRLSTQGGGQVLIEKVETSEGLRCTWALGPSKDATLRVVAEGKKIPAGIERGEVRVWVKGGSQPLILPVRLESR